MKTLIRNFDPYEKLCLTTSLIAVVLATLKVIGLISISWVALMFVFFAAGWVFNTIVLSLIFFELLEKIVKFFTNKTR
jgi:hypothetical protein